MDDATYKKWDLRLKIVAPFITVLGLFLGVWQFNKGQSEQLNREYVLLAEREKNELRRKQWDKQLDLLTKLGVSVGKVAADLRNTDRTRQNVMEFDSLYWGESNFLQDEELANELHKMHLDLVDLIHDYDTGDELTEEDKKKRGNRIRQRAISLGQKLQVASKKIFEQRYN